MVPKRVGIGETINTGTTAGKIIMGGVVVLLVAVIGGVSFMLIRSELTSPSLTITAEHDIAIDYPMYSFTFDMEEIEEVELVTSIPSGAKANGDASNIFARGHVRLSVMGELRLLVILIYPHYTWNMHGDQY